MRSYWFEYLQSTEYEEWNEFVDHSPQGSIYAKTWYLDAIGYPYRIGVLRNNENIQAGIILTKNELNTFSNPLFAKYLGILSRAINSKYETRLTTEKEWIELIIENIKHIKTFDYTFHPNFTNWMPFYWKGYKEQTRYTYILENLRDIDRIFADFKGTVRTDIRKALKHDLAVKTDVDVDRFYEMNKLAFKKSRGGIPFSFKRFWRLYESLLKKQSIKLFAITDNKDNWHAIAGVVYDENSCNLILNASDPRFLDLKGNSLLVFETIRFASKISKVYDFEGSMIEPIERFYRAFGGKQVRYFSIWKNSFINMLKKDTIKICKDFLYDR